MVKNRRNDGCIFSPKAVWIVEGKQTRIPPRKEDIPLLQLLLHLGYANVRALRTPMLRHPRSHIPSCGKTAAKEIVFQMKCSYLGTTVNAGIVKSSNLPPPTLFSDVFPENSIKKPVSCEHNVTIKGQAFIIQFATQGGCSDEGRDANPCKSLALRAIQCV